MTAPVITDWDNNVASACGAIASLDHPRCLDDIKPIIQKAIEVDRSTRKTEAGALDSVFEQVRYMIDAGYSHKTKGYQLREMTFRDQLEHLKDEADELGDARSTQEQRQELADVLGVVFHMAVYFGDTPQALATRLNEKLRERFERREKVALTPEYHERRVRELEDLIQHCWVHSGYKNCGYDQMTAEQRKLYDAIKAKTPEEVDPDNAPSAAAATNWSAKFNPYSDPPNYVSIPLDAATRERLIKQANGATLCGIPVEKLSRDYMLAAIGCMVADRKSLIGTSGLAIAPTRPAEHPG